MTEILSLRSFQQISIKHKMLLSYSLGEQMSEMSFTGPKPTFQQCYIAQGSWRGESVSLTFATSEEAFVICVAHDPFLHLQSQ